MLKQKPSTIANCLSVISKDLLGVCDKDGMMLSVNEPLAYYLEQPACNVVGKDVKTLFSAANKKLNDLISTAVDQEEDHLRFINNLKHRDGSVSSLSWEIAKLQDLFIISGKVIKCTDSDRPKWGEKFRKISETISECFFILDHNFNVIFKNETAEKTFSSAQFDQDINIFFGSFPEETNFKFRDHFAHALEFQKELTFVEFSPLLNSWFSIKVLCFGQELHILANDISNRVIDHKLNELELKTFQMKIEKDFTFPEVIKFLLSGFEDLYPHLHASVLEVKNDQVWHVAAPHLPPSYCSALNGVNIGPKVGSCGSAAYLKKTVTAFDIETDERWINHKQLILPYGYQSCWSFPILSSRTLEVMATLALYSKAQRIPTENESKSIARMCNIIKIFFEDLKQENIILSMNNRYQMVTMATNDAIYDWNLKNNEVYWSENLYSIFGFKPQETHKRKNWWINHVHREDRQEVIKLLKKCLRKKESGWIAEYRLKCKNGGFKYVYNRGHIMYDQNQSPVTMIGAIQDITRLKERELEIVNQNNKLKEIAQISSHDLRRPVTSILGLTSLFNNDNLADENNKMVIGYLQSATKELDKVIHTIVAKTLEADYNVLDVNPKNKTRKR